MLSHHQRVIDEKNALDEKLEKLKAFIESSTDKELLGEERALLAKQFNVMAEYSGILSQRIAAFPDLALASVPDLALASVPPS